MSFKSQMVSGRWGWRNPLNQRVRYETALGEVSNKPSILNLVISK